ncbi:hypothetical protein DIS24_g11461 [Lasiodiplodia hormozganensis]|uniref:Uncharacterized protein n=1 Tax=Lasiodiplodia hormozganensis TaxID=869390 RepID=A0AA39WT43_9PEZI|nr:hypothetical protein DIS24_g11461 [Lasiodiplodia hormozganensis]
MEALYANVRLTYPSYRFDTAPMPIPNSTVFFARNYNAFSSAFRGVFPAPMKFLLHNGSMPPEADPTRIDPFFRALIWGPDGIPISEFSDPSKINTTLIPGIERLRARQLAQLLSSAYRSANATEGLVQHDYADGETPPDLQNFLANLTGTLIDDSIDLVWCCLFNNLSQDREDCTQPLHSNLFNP